MPMLNDAQIRQLTNGPESFTPDQSWILGQSSEVSTYHGILWDISFCLFSMPQLDVSSVACISIDPSNRRTYLFWMVESQISWFTFSYVQYALMIMFTAWTNFLSLKKFTSVDWSGLSCIMYLPCYLNDFPIWTTWLGICL